MLGLRKHNVYWVFLFGREVMVVSWVWPLRILQLLEATDESWVPSEDQKWANLYEETTDWLLLQDTPTPQHVFVQTQK